MNTGHLEIIDIFPENKPTTKLVENQNITDFDVTYIVDSNLITNPITEYDQLLEIGHYYFMKHETYTRPYDAIKFVYTLEIDNEPVLIIIYNGLMLSVSDAKQKDFIPSSLDEPYRIAFMSKKIWNSSGTSYWNSEKWYINIDLLSNTYWISGITKENVLFIIDKNYTDYDSQSMFTIAKLKDYNIAKYTEPIDNFTTRFWFIDTNPKTGNTSIEMSYQMRRTDSIQSYVIIDLSMDIQDGDIIKFSDNTFCVRNRIYKFITDKAVPGLSLKKNKWMYFTDIIIL